MHVTVDERFRRRGIAARLIQMAVEEAFGQFGTLEFSTYSDEGAKFLPGVVDRLRGLFPDIRIIEKMPGARRTDQLPATARPC